MTRLRSLLYYASGYAACAATMTGAAFAFGYVTHTGIFA